MRSFWLALQFLTRLPTPRLDSVSEVELGRSLIFYPVVGLLLGLCLLLMGQLVAPLAPAFAAALLLALWVFLGGALHIDGLADMADAWVGGLGDRERTLAIMKDPYCGPMGVTAVVMLLLLKFAALIELLSLAPWWLVAVPVVGRGAALLLMLTTPYARGQGIASGMMRQLPRRGVWAMLLLVTALLLAWQPLWMAWSLLGIVPGVWLFRAALMRRLHGFTGDTAGALIELSELLALITPLLLTAGG